jgi:hypothetical protein
MIREVLMFLKYLKEYLGKAKHIIEIILLYIKKINSLYKKKYYHCRFDIVLDKT